MATCIITSKIEKDVVTVVDSRTVQEAINIMVARGIGLVVVTNAAATEVVGVFSERDLVRRVVGKNKNPAATQLKHVITRNLIKVPHDSSCSTCLNLMKENGCRHLLAYEQGRFVGIVSMRDVAQLVGGSKPAIQDVLVNMMGGITFLFAIAAILSLAFMVPKMLEVANRFFIQ